MKKRLKTLFLRQRTKEPPVGLLDNTRVYAIGDIHGRLDLLQRVHQKILQHALGYQGEKTVVYLGDYIDRGPQSKQVVDYLLSDPLSDFNSVFLLGNHEEVLMQFIEGCSFNVIQDWFSFGGLSTLQSYGVTFQGVPSVFDFNRFRKEFSANCPAAHLNFYRNLRLSFQKGGYFFVHAGIKPKVSLRKQNNHDLLWIRDEFTNCQKKYEKIIVHGHSVTESPEIKANRIGLDTGAFASGRLTCAVFEGVDVDVLSTSVNPSDVLVTSHVA